MKKEQVIITTVSVSKAGQLVYFQVKLPKDTERIIGIETGGRLIAAASGSAFVFPPVVSHTEGRSPTFFKRNTLIGDLKLQSCEEANIFYSNHVMTDENIGAGDYSQRIQWQASPFTHENKSEEDIVVVKGGSTIVQGIFKDRYGDTNKTDISYEVKVYVWIETACTCQTKKEQHQENKK